MTVRQEVRGGRAVVLVSDVAGGGGFGDLGTHALDLMLWMMGAPTSVTASIEVATGRYGPDCDEYGEGLLKFDGGAIGSLAAGWVDVAESINQLRIFKQYIEPDAQAGQRKDHIEPGNPVLACAAFMGNQQKRRKQREAEEQPHVLFVEKQPAEHLRDAQEKEPLPRRN